MVGHFQGYDHLNNEKFDSFNPKSNMKIMYGLVGPSHLNAMNCTRREHNVVPIDVDEQKSLIWRISSLFIEVQNDECEWLKNKTHVYEKFTQKNKVVRIKGLLERKQKWTFGFMLRFSI